MITLNQNYERRHGQFNTATLLEEDEAKLSALTILKDSMAEEAKLDHRLTNNLVADIDASIAATELEIARKIAEKVRAAEIAEAERKAQELNDQQAEAEAAKKREEDRIQREREAEERETQLRLEAERNAARRLEERLLIDERVCFDVECKEWMFR